ncbi:haloacid dehalogenase type II [Vallicoccus soli]|uniref:Haloacid dehalogenase type II n=1 Tax=Vallicoccus soli TaxID=2339232 RepID=A0A3A3YNP5_9ACTN|nr:haloacid dehalogenase type II [Vallicoccus soli]RJK92778.1 haloacid dehalogenase type II [Vallicoccus soli]
MPLATRPRAVVLDVNETLSDLAPLGPAFEEEGAPAHLAPLWFASVLRDGFGLSLAGAPRPFVEVAAGALRPLLAAAGVEDLDGAGQRVLDALGTLPVRADVPEGLQALAAAGLRVVTLTNGAVATTDALLRRGAARPHVDLLLSVEDAGAWKPDRRAYEHAARATRLAPQDLLLVAVHPWDVDGAARAGLRTAWLDRAGTPYPSHATLPDLVARDLLDLAGQLA